MIPNGMSEHPIVKYCTEKLDRLMLLDKTIFVIIHDPKNVIRFKDYIHQMCDEYTQIINNVYYLLEYNSILDDQRDANMFLMRSKQELEHIKILIEMANGMYPEGVD